MKKIFSFIVVILLCCSSSWGIDYSSSRSSGGSASRINGGTPPTSTSFGGWNSSGQPTDSTAAALEAVQDNIGGTTGGDGFLRSGDGHLVYTYNDVGNILTLTVVPTIFKFPTYIEFGGTTTQQYDVSGSTYVSAVTRGVADGDGKWGGATPGIPNNASSGHALSDCLTAIGTALDGQYLEVKELTGAASATNPLSVQFIFTGITNFGTIATRSYYVGSVSHNMRIQLYNWGTSSWDTFASFSGEADYVQRSLAVFNIGTGGNSGKVILQFIHTSSGISSHLIRFDYVALIDGGQGGSSSSTASSISNVPEGTITATNVQTALNQLDTLKLPLAGGTMSGAITFAGGQTWPTFNQDTTGSSGSLKSPSTTGLTTITGPGSGQTRAKTVRDADDTILEQAGSYTPSGTWNWGTATVNDFTANPGTELITNGTFDSNTTGWTASSSTLSASGGYLTVTNSGVAYGRAAQGFSTVIGKAYKFSADFKKGTASASYLYVGIAAGQNELVNIAATDADWTTYTREFVAVGTTTWVSFVNNNTDNGTGLFDNASVKPLPLTISGDLYSSGKARFVLPVYANNAAAVAGGLLVGQLYRTGADPDQVCIVH
jgi:hypothetical protein